MAHGPCSRLLFLSFVLHALRRPSFVAIDGHAIQQGQSPADLIEDMRSLGMVFCRQGANSYEKAENMYRK